MAKQILYGDEARRAAKAGIDKLANSVKATLGPRGQYVVLEREFGNPTITNDGVTIAREIELEDPFENIGAQLIREVSSKTNDVSGDGTTTACVLAQSIMEHGYRNIASGASGIQIKRGIDKAVDWVVAILKDIAVKIDLKNKDKARREVFNIANISANDSAIAEKITDAMLRVGTDGVVTVEESKTSETVLEIVDGMQFEQGFSSPFFITDIERREAVLDDPYILLVDKRLSDVRELIPILSKLSEEKKSFLIVADDYDQQVLATVVLNNLNKVFRCVAVKSPGFGNRKKEILQDIAVLSKGKVITDELGLRVDRADITMLGQAKRIVVTKETTTIIGAKGNKKEIEERAAGIKKQIEETVSDFEKNKLVERLAKLTGGVGIIYVGGMTESELKAKKYKVEDALHATKAALEEGIVPGGGVALFRASERLRKIIDTSKSQFLEYSDELIGAKLIQKVLEEPIRVIGENAGEDGGVICRALHGTNNPNFGFNASNMKYEDMIQSGVIDPVKVTRTALQNAASVCGLLLTTKVLVVNIPDKNKKEDPLSGL